MPPFQQGTFDKLCGLYALINASRLAVPKLTEAQCEQAYTEAVQWIGEQQNPSDILRNGLNVNQLQSIHSHVLQPRWRTSLHKPFWTIQYRPNDKKFWEWMDREVRRPHQGILISIAGRMDHWSVVRDITPKSIMLFDSHNLQSLRRTICATSEQPRNSHIIEPRYVLVITG